MAGGAEIKIVWSHDLTQHLLRIISSNNEYVQALFPQGRAAQLVKWKVYRDVCMELFKQRKEDLWFQFQEKVGRVERKDGGWVVTAEWTAKFKDPVRSRLERLRQEYTSNQEKWTADPAWASWEEVSPVIRGPMQLACPWYFDYHRLLNPNSSREPRLPSRSPSPLSRPITVSSSRPRKREREPSGAPVAISTLSTDSSSSSEHIDLPLDRRAKTEGRSLSPQSSVVRILSPDRPYRKRTRVFSPISITSDGSDGSLSDGRTAELRRSDETSDSGSDNGGESASLGGDLTGDDPGNDSDSDPEIRSEAGSVTRDINLSESTGKTLPGKTSSKNLRRTKKRKAQAATKKAVRRARAETERQTKGSLALQNLFRARRVKVENMKRKKNIRNLPKEIKQPTAEAKLANKYLLAHVAIAKLSARTHLFNGMVMRLPPCMSEHAPLRQATKPLQKLVTSASGRIILVGDEWPSDMKKLSLRCGFPEHRMAGQTILQILELYDTRFKKKYGDTGERLRLSKGQVCLIPAEFSTYPDDNENMPSNQSNLGVKISWPNKTMQQLLHIIYGNGYYRRSLFGLEDTSGTPNWKAARDVCLELLNEVGEPRWFKEQAELGRIVHIGGRWRYTEEWTNEVKNPILERLGWMEKTYEKLHEHFGWREEWLDPSKSPPQITAKNPWYPLYHRLLQNPSDDPSISNLDQYPISLESTSNKRAKLSDPDMPSRSLLSDTAAYIPDPESPGDPSVWAASAYIPGVFVDLHSHEDGLDHDDYRHSCGSGTSPSDAAGVLSERKSHKRLRSGSAGSSGTTITDGDENNGDFITLNPSAASLYPSHEYIPPSYFDKLVDIPTHCLPLKKTPKALRRARASLRCLRNTRRIVFQQKSLGRATGRMIRDLPFKLQASTTRSICLDRFIECYGHLVELMPILGTLCRSTVLCQALIPPSAANDPEHKHHVQRFEKVYALVSRTGGKVVCDLSDASQTSTIYRLIYGGRDIGLARKEDKAEQKDDGAAPGVTLLAFMLILDKMFFEYTTGALGRQLA